VTRLASELGIDPAGPRALALVVAFVGAGGKTSAMFALARELESSRTILTTTTMIRDPRLEASRLFDRVLIDESLAGPDEGKDSASSDIAAPLRGARPLVIASGLDESAGKLRGIDPGRVRSLRASCDLVLVEADGSRALPVKAPAAWEPVLPDCADFVVGVIGLDCLGAPLGPGTAHRPELLGPLVGCAAGAPIRAEHLVRLARSSEGLFKSAPTGARCAILLNKADAAPLAALCALVDLLSEDPGPAELVLVCSLRDGTELGESSIAWRRVGGGWA
jgi:probable selenium-dependent hydroxylase accessory protein YqeC